MSADNNNPCEVPSSSWDYYSIPFLRLYFIRNGTATDCSFVINDPENKGHEKILHSFKWILCDASRELKKILNDEVNVAKNCKLIPISDTNFEIILSFVHTKRLDHHSFDPSFDFLLNLYKSAMKFEINSLKEKILTHITNVSNHINWINYYRIVFLEYGEYSNIYNVFCAKLQKASTLDVEGQIESNMEMIMDFHLNMFDHFLYTVTKWTVTVKPSLRFKILENYLLKNVFKEKTLKPGDEQENITKDTMTLWLDGIDIEKMSVEEFHEGPGKSILLDAAAKERILKKIRK